MRNYYDEKELRIIGYKSVGKDVRVSKLAVITHPELVSIGSHVAIDPFCSFSTQAKIGNHIHIATGTIVLGSKKSKLIMEDYSFLSAHSILICGTDDYSGEYGLANSTIPMKYKKSIFGTIIFKKHSGTGVNTIVMPNVVIGEGTVTGACTLVTKSLEPWGIYINIPARRVKERRRDLIEKYTSEIHD